VGANAWRHRAALSAPALAGVVALLAVNRLGPYTSPDSVFYVGTARSLLDGAGFAAPPGTQALSNFPPLLPLLLAGIGRLGIDPLDVLRWLNPVLFGLTVALAGTVVGRRTGSTAVGLIAAVVLLVARDLLAVGGSALSEPLFILLALAAMVSLARFVDGGDHRWFWVSGALVAAAFLTRYVGVTVALAGTVVLLRAGRRKEAALYAVVTVAPVVAWLAWAGLGGGHLAVHVFDLEYLARGADSASRWVLPAVVPTGIRVAVAVVVAAAVVVVGRRAPRPGQDVLASVLATFALLYLGLLLADRVFLDATGRLDGRFLAPLHVVVVILVASMARRAVDTGLLRHRAVAVAGVVLVALHAGQAVWWVAGGLTDDGITRRGYTAAAWRQSPVMVAIGGLGPDVPVFSNGADAIFLHTGRATTQLPVRVEYRTGEPNRDYLSELESVRAALAGGGVLVYFQAITARDRFLPSASELEARLGLRVVERDRVGTVYGLSGS
jgi:Dolichyl-phosphate-mannose-protein mannosyltransferase